MTRKGLRAFMWAAISTLTLTACQSAFADRKVNDAGSDMTATQRGAFQQMLQDMDRCVVAAAREEPLPGGNDTETIYRLTDLMERCAGMMRPSEPV